MALRPQHVAPELLTKVTKTLGITALDQWYYVSHYAATKAIGPRALKKCGGTLASFLQYAYPEHRFDEEKLSRINIEKDQNFFGVIVRKLFPDVEIKTKARKAVGIVNPETGAFLEIDFWIPSLKLGIEYQDKHHYEDQWYANSTLEEYRKRDDIKKVTMSKLGYTLITVGFWWNKTIESVAATIRKYRPDLLKDYKHNTAEPIPPDPPSGYITESSVIPGVPSVMSPFIPSPRFNPTNWYAGEKHDGIRGVYNPKSTKMFSRLGNEFSVLPSLLKDVPNMLVEGEIVAGRGNYTNTAAVSHHTHPDKVNWPIFRYIVFDIPDAELGNYTQRYSTISRGLLDRSYIFSQQAFRVLIVNKAHLKMLVNAIISDGGEGVIAQQDAKYEYGRTKGLAKIKVRRDEDAQVLSVNEFSCTCKLVNGAHTDIIFSDEFEPSNLKVGDIVSYYYNGHSANGLPKRAEIYKIRYDITWEVLTNKEKNITKRRSVKETIGSRSLASVRNKIGHWNKSPNVRAYFDQFAKTSGFDPLVAKNWYPVRISTLINAQGGGLLTAYGKIKNALAIAYPELKFEARKFRTCNHPKVKNTIEYWKEPYHARAFFDKFARAAGFDPLAVENWSSVRLKELIKAKGSSLLRAFGNRKKALSFAYPELEFDSTEFRTSNQPKGKLERNEMGHWTKAANLRSFFDEFATKQGFDPLVVRNWYTLRVSALQNTRGSGLFSVYGYNRKKALSIAYPELKFRAKKFITRNNVIYF